MPCGERTVAVIYLKKRAKLFTPNIVADWKSRAASLSIECARFARLVWLTTPLTTYRSHPRVPRD
jgi:hypothetical protein